MGSAPTGFGPSPMGPQPTGFGVGAAPQRFPTMPGYGAQPFP